MLSRAVLGLYGALWFACGMVIRVNPPAAVGWVAVATQLVGWLVAVGGVFALLTAVSRARFEIVRPRRRLNAGASRRREIALVTTAVLAVLVGGWLLWWGVDGGIRALTGTGLVVLSAVPILVVYAARNAHFGGDAAHRLS